ncbi:MAG: anhydro-N-acetylmuramic acid kinase [Marinoscillum sp.]
MTEYHVIGLMSGSSLDGLDICACKFSLTNHWKYKIVKTETVTIPPDLKEQLRKSEYLDSKGLGSLDDLFGRWIAATLDGWLIRENFTPELIGLHGHTVFHDPSKEVSIQIGNGKLVAETLGVSVVDNFRIKDILNGGQGAPLVPVGEHFLFSGNQGFINLGGIANISLHQDQITAWDIAPCNQVLNHFAEKCGLTYDKGGLLAQQGRVELSWLKYLNGLDYFRQEPPKSLSNQWTKKVLNNHPEDPKDALATYCDFLSSEIVKSLQPPMKVMVTGGGAFNRLLIDQIRMKASESCEIIIPDTQLLEFKEALIFGFLALLRKLNMVNVFASVTGAQQDTVSGDLHLMNG